VQRILIVDSDRSRSRKLTFLLQHMGYGVDVHPGGAGRGRVCPEPDLVLLSEHILDAHADDVLPWMLQCFDVPKVVLGNEPEEVAGVPYLEMGADAYLPAPLDLRVLLARVRSVLSRSVADDETQSAYAAADVGRRGAGSEGSVLGEAM